MVSWMPVHVLAHVFDLVGTLQGVGYLLQVVASPVWLVAAALICCITLGLFKVLIDRVESRLARRLQLANDKSYMYSDVGAAVATPTDSSDISVREQAPVASVIVQVSQTGAGPAVFVASAEAPLGSGLQPTLAQGHDAADVINQVLAKVYPAKMNGQIGSVRLLPGVYPLATPLVVSRGDLTLCGSTGVVLVRAQSPSLNAKDGEGGMINTGPLISVDASNVVIRDMQLDGAVQGTGSPKMGVGASGGVVISGALSNVLVENVGVRNVSGTAISAVINDNNAPAGGVQSGIVVRGCVIDRCGMGGVSLAKRGSVNLSSDIVGGAIVVRSLGHLVFGNRISRTGSHAVCLTGVSCSQVVANQIQHVSLYNEVGVFGHGIAVDGNCGDDPVETVVISANIIDTVHLPANKRNATCTGIEIADGISGAICTSNHVSNVALGYGVYFGGGIAPSSNGVIASNVVIGCNGYGVWVNARGQQPSTKFPHSSSDPSAGCVVVGNCLQGNAPAGLRSDNVSDETIVGNVVSNSDGAAALMLLGGNRRVTVVANTVGGQLVPSKTQAGLLIQPSAPSSDATHSYSPSSGSGLIDILVRGNVSPDHQALSGHGLNVAGTETPRDDQSRSYSSVGGDMVVVGANVH